MRRNLALRRYQQMLKMLSNKINFPVVLDNDFSIWNAYQNQYWPAHYLIDKQGKIRRVHFGEGQYNETEKAIRALLAEDGTALNSSLVTNGSEKVPASAG